MTVRILGLVAAAGNSGRMGTPKALLSTRLVDHVGPDEPWARRIARVLLEGGASDVVVTVPDGDVGDAVSAVVSDLARTTRNGCPAEGLSGSITAALDLVDAPGFQVDGLVLCPVDAPGIDGDIVAALLQALQQHGCPVVVSCGGRPGHPVAFPRASFVALRRAGRSGGPRAILEAGPRHVLEVHDERVLWNLDTPAAIDAVRRRQPPDRPC